MRFFATAVMAAAAVAAVASSALAAPAPQWVVDKAASQVRFASSFSGAAFSGGFARWDADIRFDPANLAGSSVTASFDTGSAATGDADRDQSLPSATFFDAGKFPRATFTAHDFKALGGNRYVANGALTLRGVTKPLALPFTLVVNGPVARMNAGVAINRLAFGVGQDQWAKVDALPNPVTITIALTARRK